MSQTIRALKNVLRKEMRKLLNQIPLEVIEQERKICYVPRWNNDEMEMVKLHSYKDYLSLPVNRWNIPEPNHDESRDIASELDLIIMPGLAFDLQGNRLGHGKGYYDKYLAKCQRIYNDKNKPIPKTIALVLESQILKDKLIPTTQYDQKPNLIISHNNIISQ
ncbi:11603_t:CDS:2 [Funneliformis geosporum]|uniref:5-formyltetrahydrofolate cyclo-ligase n=1 Tax=Funneliformis geosporum TaxID=1117311 RepID=A0A9W4SS59_9GLOM|nr:11603_t:CDS:2 [Funneliformis geosporum]CAI2178928.1 17163_t:CDS:2 [Funneliformis geosporum]